MRATPFVHDPAETASTISLRCRPRWAETRTGDNGLAETKDGAVARKEFDCWHIRRRHAARFDTCCCGYLNPFLNFYRPCLFASELADPKSPAESSACTARATR